MNEKKSSLDSKIKVGETVVPVLNKAEAADLTVPEGAADAALAKLEAGLTDDDVAELRSTLQAVARAEDVRRSILSHAALFARIAAALA